MDLYIDREEMAYELQLLANTFLTAGEMKKFAVKKLNDEKDAVSSEDKMFIFRKEENMVQGRFGRRNEPFFEIEEQILFSEDIKNAYKRTLYRLMSRIYPQSSHPWGILTGIRPVKIVHELQKHTLDEEELRTHLSRRYLIKPEKITLSLEIAKLQQAHFETLDKSMAVYIGIPFCPSRCSYCSFFSMALSQKDADRLSEQYLDALEKEMDRVVSSGLLRERPLTSIYIGGGTPGALSSGQIRRLLDMTERYFSNHPMEYTFEAGRVDALDEEKLRLIKDSAVTRISINPQTMNDDTLYKIGRKHTAQDVVDCYHLARSIGFDNINMDIILGLEDETIGHVENTLRQIQKLDPDSLTVHTLAVKRASKLREELDEEKKHLSSADIVEFMEKSTDYANRMQMLPYYLYRQKNMLFNLENTGYAKKGKESLYNIGMMEERQTILAFGSGSISKFVYPKENRIERVGNVKEVRLYIDKVTEAVEKKLQELRRWHSAVKI